MARLFSYFSKNIRRSLYFLVACAIFPALFIILYVGLAQRNQAVADANEYMANLASSVVTIQKEKASQIKVLLQTLSSVPVVRDREVSECKTLFAHIMANDPALANVMLVSRDGEVLASGRPLHGPVRYDDRDWFRDAVRTKDFWVGEYALGQSVGTIPIMRFGYPLLGEDGSLTAVLFAVYDLRKLEEFYESLVLPRNCRATLIDRDGLRYLSLATHVDPLPRGEPVRADLWERISGSEDESGYFITHRFEGGASLFRFCKIRLKPGDQPYATVMMSIPLEVVFKKANEGLWMNLMLLGLAAAAALFIAKTLGRSMVLAQVEALRKSEDRYRSLVEDQTEMVARFTPDSTYTFVNDALCRAIGKGREELIGMGWYSLVQAEDLPGIRQKISRLTPESPVVVIETRFDSASRDIRWVQFTNRGFFDDQGNLVEIQSVGRDVTERKRAEETLQESWEQLDLVLVGSQLGFWDWNITTGEVRRNERWGEMLGYSREDVEFTVRQWKDFVHPDDLDRAWLSITDHLEGRTPMHRAEYRMRAKDGGYVWILDQAMVVKRDEEGKPLRMCGTHTDMSERKMSEEALHESEQRFRDLFDFSPVPMGFVTRDGRILDVNERFVQVLGYTLEDIPDLEQWRQRAYPDPEYRQAVIRNWDAAMSGDGRHLSEFPSGEYRVTCKNGDVRSVLISGITVSGGILSSLFDITDYKRLEEGLRASKETAEAANRAKSEFLANMSHEIRTPLNGALGMLQLLATTGTDDEQKEYLLGATQSINRLTRLLSDILDISRIEAGKLQIVETAFNIKNTRASIKEIFDSEAKRKGIRLEFGADENLPLVLVGDEVRVRQILFNLVGNAIKFTDEGAVRVTAASLPGATSSSVRVSLSVSDTGIGIPEKNIKDVFEPFVQGENSYTRRYQGAGLGLSIVRRLVNLLGGELSIESAPGAGTTVRVSLPFKLPGEAAENAGQERQEKPLPPGAPVRILFAEDDAVSLIAGKRMLEKSGYSVTTAMDGREALRRLAEEDFDLVLMDIQMPVMDGVEATKAIRESRDLGAKASIPIIAMTAYSMEGDRDKFLEAGMDDYIAKPVDKATLLETIERVMSKAGEVA